MGPQVPRMHLPARWIQRRETPVRMWSQTSSNVKFETSLPSGALNRLDDFRDGGKLHARVEGTVNLLLLRDDSLVGLAPTEQLTRIWWDTANNNFVVSDDILSESFELSKERWCTEVLRTLRPPGHVVFEMTVPRLEALGDAAKRCLGHLDGAQAALDQDRIGDSVRLVYRALEELRHFNNEANAVYGDYRQKRLAEQAKSLRSLCNPERHASEVKDGGLEELPRRLANYLLIAARALCATYICESPRA